MLHRVSTSSHINVIVLVMTMLSNELYYKWNANSAAIFKATKLPSPFCQNGVEKYSLKIGKFSRFLSRKYIWIPLYIKIGQKSF